MGYMLGGLDWTHTAIGKAFQAQEQVLFFFAAIFFIISVTLHLFSIKEQPYSRHRREGLEGEEEVDDLSLVRANGSLPHLDFIGEEEPGRDWHDEHDQNEQEVQMDFLNVDMVRCKSDSVLAMPDATIELDPDLDRDRTLGLIPDVDSPFVTDDDAVFRNFQPTEQSPLQYYGSSLRSRAQASASRDERLSGASKTGNGAPAGSSSGAFALANKVNQRPPCAPPRHRHFSFYRQPSFTFSYYGRVAFLRSRRTRGNMSPMRITSSRSMNDIYELPRRPGRRLQERGLSVSGSEDEESEDGEAGTTVKLLWLSMLKMPRQLARLCLCHLFTWFAIMAEAVFYTDFMGQVIFKGDPKVN